MSSLEMPGAALAAGAAGAVALGALAWTVVAPASTFWGPLHWRANADAPAGFALTFDDGPTPGSTAATLDILGEHNAVATFFVIGVNSRRCPDLLLRMRDEGHLIANHSMHHSHLGIFGRSGYWQRELSDTDTIIEQIIGTRPRFFRPPLGVKTPYLMRAAARTGHHVVTWTRRAIDGVPTTSARILRRLGNSTQRGDILLLHDGVEPHLRRDPSPTVAAISPLLRRLHDRGLTPAPLEQLLQMPAYVNELTPSNPRF
jgi:peptidoglycan/xylan/chitin deacetylase (PgdA/CDA1 family)